MKTMKIIAIALIASSVTFIACQKDEEPVSQEETIEVQKPAQAISMKKAKTLQQEYISTRANLLNNLLQAKGTIQGEDVRDVWYDLEVIEQYIAYVKAEAKKKGYENLGLRVHLGAYPNEEGYHNPGNTTFFFVPTYQNTSASKNLVYKNSDNITAEGIDALNYGQGGNPPRNLE